MKSADRSYSSLRLFTYLNLKTLKKGIILEIFIGWNSYGMLQSGKEKEVNDSYDHLDELLEKM